MLRAASKGYLSLACLPDGKAKVGVMGGGSGRPRCRPGQPGMVAVNYGRRLHLPSWRQRGGTQNSQRAGTNLVGAHIGGCEGQLAEAGCCEQRGKRI